MTFLHATLLAGLGLIVIPILVHMMAKSTPKKIVFPALRFVRETVVVAERGWKVKHWLLMALRILLIAMLAMALAFPRVHSGMLATFLSIGLVAILAVLATAAAFVAYAMRRPWLVCGVVGLIAALLWVGTIGWSTVAFLYGTAPPTQANSGPIAAALIIDNSPTMSYRANNVTRLEQAKEMGNWLIDRLPVESQLSIVTNEQGLRLTPDRITAQRQLSRIEVDGKAVSLPARILAAVELVRNSNLERREVYVLTDLAKNVWKDGGAELSAALQKEPQVLLQVVDLGIEKGQNWSLIDPKVSQQVVTPGGSVEVQAEVVASTFAPNQQLVVEFLQEPVDGDPPFLRNGKTVVSDPKAVDRQIIDLAPTESKTVRFVARELQSGTHHFFLRINQPDPVAIDNQVYASVDVQQQGQLLVVADDVELGQQIAGIMNPDIMASGKDITNQVDFFRIDTANFNQYAAIALFDPPMLSASTVEKLEAFVQNGGGLLIILGARNTDPVAIQQSALAKLLPGVISNIESSNNRSLILEPVSLNHPIFHPFDKVIDDAPWHVFPVYRYWSIDKLSKQVSVLVRYSKGDKPAILEESRGSGKILTWTTPVPEPAVPDERDAWNDLWSAADPWPSYALMLGSIRYLSGWGKYQFNYGVGETAILENDLSVFPSRYEVFAPMDEHMSRDAEGGVLTFPFIHQPGIYRFLGLKDGKASVRGFAANLHRNDTPLDRIEPESLDAIIGKDKYAVAREKAEVTSSIGTARFGRDLYPFLMVVVVALVLAEQAMSSRFYSIRFSGSSGRS